MEGSGVEATHMTDQQLSHVELMKQVEEHAKILCSSDDHGSEVLGQLIEEARTT